MAWDPAATISNEFCLVYLPYDLFSPVTPASPQVLHTLYVSRLRVIALW